MAFVEKLVKEKGIRLRLIVEATKENIDFINSIRSHEIRCLSEINGNFGIFDNRAYMVYIYHTKSDRLDQTLWSNSKTLVDKQQTIFDKLWEMAMPLKVRTKELDREYITNYNKTLSSLEEARAEIRFLVEQSRKELLLFASKKILNTIMTNDSFLDYFLPAIKRDIKIKILIDDIGEHLLDQIKSINDSKTNNLCEVGFTNQLGNFNEMVILLDNKYILR